jgi:hypothetical protein
MRRTLAVALLLGSATTATANSLTWDSSGANPASPVDGSGTWDTTTPLWSDGTSDAAWDNANADTPVFGNGGFPGTVTVDPNGVTAAGFTLRSGYTITGGPITLAPGNDVVSGLGSGMVPVVYSSLAGSDQARNVTFSGYVILAAGANSYVGSSTVSHAGVLIGNNADQHFTAPFGAPGNALTLDTSTLTANGSRTGASVSYRLPYDITVTGNNTIFTGKNFTLGALDSTLYTVRGDGSLIFNNNISATTSNISASFSGTGPDAFTGTLHLNTIGANTIKLYPTLSGNFLGVPNGTLDVNAFASPQTVGGPFTFTIGALTGNGSLGGGFTSATIATWSVGSLGLATTYFGTINGNAALTLTGGTLTLNNVAPDTYIGPTIVAGGTLVLARANLTSTSSISVAGGAALRLQPGISVNTATLSLAPGSTLDITSNSETFDTTVPGHDAPTLIAAIASAYDGGAWDGVGITSSTAAPSPTHNPVLSIGYRVTGSELLVQLTHIGDANLDGRVDADDYALLDRAYASSLPNAHWTDGDFNYDGVIDAGDYQLVDRAYYLTHDGFAPGFLARRESQFGDTYVSTLLARLPEPSLGAWLIVAFPLFVRRRARR